MALAAIVLTLTGIGGWFSGTINARLKDQQMISDLAETEKRANNLRVQLGASQDEARALRRSLEQAGADKLAAQTDTMRREILRLQAELNSVRESGAEDQKKVAENERMIGMLSRPGIQFVPFRSMDAANPVAYALLAEQDRLLLIVSNLPKPANGHDYQVWIYRSQDPKVVSGGLLYPEENGKATLEISNTDALRAVSSIAITSEPAGGTDAPSGPKLLEGTIGE
jgi:hypothetical protein